MALILLAIPSSPTLGVITHPASGPPSFLSVYCIPPILQPYLHGKLQTMLAYLCVYVCVWDWNSCRGARGLAWTCAARLISWCVVAVFRVEIAGMLWMLRVATRCWNATSSAFIICYHAEFVVFCFASQYRHLFVLMELLIDIRLC